MARLGDVCTLVNGYAFKPTDWSDSGLPIIRIQNLNDESATFNYFCGSIDSKYLVRNGDLLFSWSGTPGTSFGAFFWNRGEGVLNQHIFNVHPNESLYKPYFRYALNGNLDRIIAKAHGGVGLQHITKKELVDIEIPIPALNDQIKIAGCIEKVELLIVLRKRQLVKLDELVKVRFVEMFGDLEHNEKAIQTLPMTELCEIIDGDRGINYPKQEEFSDNGFCLFLNAKNVTVNGFSFENCMFITEEKDKLLRKGKLSRGDVVLTTRGTLGNLAYYDYSVPYKHVRINSGMVILRMKRDRITERFFIEQFKMQLASIKEKIASGSAQPQLPISTMNKIMLLVPDIEEQERFADFVVHTNKSKAEIRRSLEQLETLKKALMQKYFG